jgi:hypothetical protein
VFVITGLPFGASKPPSLVVTAYGGVFVVFEAGGCFEITFARSNGCLGDEGGVISLIVPGELLEGG